MMRSEGVRVTHMLHATCHMLHARMHPYMYILALSRPGCPPAAAAPPAVREQPASARHACMHARMHACMHICMHTHTHAHMHASRQAGRQARRQASKQAYTHTCMHTCMHHTQHTRIHPHVCVTCHACVTCSTMHVTNFDISSSFVQGHLGRHCAAWLGSPPGGTMQLGAAFWGREHGSSGVSTLAWIRAWGELILAL